MSEIKDVIDDVLEKAEEKSDRLISVIALLVAVLATVMAILSIKGGNIGQAMAQAQASSVNAWTYFQAKSTKQGLAESMVDQLTFERERGVALAPEAVASLNQKIESYREKVRRYEVEKEEIKAQAEGYEQTYKQLNVHDDQLDIAEAGMTVGLAVLGVAALTRRRWLVWFALVFAGVGLASGIAGFTGGSFHIDALAALLG
ncbi:MAG: DUF4337 domain-containing protein [Candidatus Accumulibacter sp. UW26]|jgi:ABC-type microcin C transport system permease subunit YejB